jgi:hypothetical protein
MINSENILHVGVIVIIVMFVMDYATNHPNRENSLIKLFSWTQVDAPTLPKVLYNWGRLTIIVGLSMQMLDVAFELGIIVFVLGLIITIAGRQIYSHNQNDENE